MPPLQDDPLDKAFGRYFKDLWKAKMGTAGESTPPSAQLPASPKAIDVQELPDRYQIDLPASIGGDRRLRELFIDVLMAPHLVDFSRAQITRSEEVVTVTLPRPGSYALGVPYFHPPPKNKG